MLKKYSCFPSNRMISFYQLANFKNLAILDISTSGHFLYNYGHLGWISKEDFKRKFFTCHLTQEEIISGNFYKKIDLVFKEIKLKRFKFIYLMSSMIGNITGMNYYDLIDRYSKKYNIKIFFTKFKTNTNYYDSLGQIYESVFDNFEFLNNKKNEKTFSIIGGFFNDENIKYHDDIQKELKKYGLKCIFDSLTEKNFLKFNNISKSNLNIVTSNNLIHLAEKIKEKYNIPYIYFNPLGMFETIDLINKILLFFNIEKKIYLEKNYEKVKEQVINILNFSNKKIIVYLDYDGINRYKKLFENELKYKSSYFCTHQNSEFEYLDINDFIDKNKKTKGVIISYDSVTKYFKNGIIDEYLDQDYHIMTPINHYHKMIDGTYRFFEKLVSLIMEY